MTAIRMETYDAGVEEVGAPGKGTFWLLLILGILWILLSFLVLQFTYKSIWSIAILVGIVLGAAALMEIAQAVVAPGWRWVHALLALLFAVGSIAAFVYPGQTFGTLALIFGWYLLIKGTFDLVTSLMLRGVQYWWLGLITGIVEIALAFWAVSYVGRSIYLL